MFVGSQGWSGSRARVDLLPWAGSAHRPFAPSLERKRLQLYLAIFLADLSILLGSFLLAGSLRLGTPLATNALRQAMLFIPLFAVLALYNRSYSVRTLTDRGYAVSRVFYSLLISAAFLLFLTFYAKASDQFSRFIFTSGTLMSFVLMTGFRLWIFQYIGRRWGPASQNILVIEDDGPAVDIAHAYRVNARSGFLQLDATDPGALDRFGRCIENMDRVIVSCPKEKRPHWAFFLRAAGVDGEVVTEVGQRLGAIGLRKYPGFTSMTVSARPLGLGDKAMKRLMDVSIAGAALLVLGPLLLLVALAIKMEDGGPVLFRQRRMGRGNRFFYIMKFRSMKVDNCDHHGVKSASRNDHRVTRVGRLIRRTSIDELPQLLNILRGNMSLVGPRPHALGSLAGEKLFWEVDVSYWHRHSLRPGLTGLAQIRGYRGATDNERDLSNRLRSDLEYIANWSPWRDVSILFQTLQVMVHSRAY